MPITYLDGDRLRRALLAGCEHVQGARAELNRINVFPVPDGDTGTNLSLTARSIAERLRATGDTSVATVARAAADAAILGARGNCGMIFSHYLLGFAEQVGARTRLSAMEFAQALEGAAAHVYAALERPVEGTIITVMRETAEAARHTGTADFAVLIAALARRAREALARTPELLPALRDAGVVDAGAAGLVHVIEGVAALVRGDPVAAHATAGPFAESPAAAASAQYPGESERYRFCTEALVRGDAMPPAEEVRAELRERGDSLIVIRSADVLKVHVHTDDPDGVFRVLRGHGTLVTHKAEDMRVQHERIERAGKRHVDLARRPIAILADSACDLPQEHILQHGITLVPLLLVLEDGTELRDRDEISAAEFFQRLRDGEHPTTSQPAPAAFLEGYARAALDGEEVLGVILSGALSGTFASAEAAAKRFADAPVHLVDSRAASLTQGLLVLLAAELAERGRPPAEIAAEIARVRDQSGLFFTVETFDNLLASGRVGRGRAFFGDLLDIKPVLWLEPSGRIVPVAKVRGSVSVLPRMLRLLESKLPADPQRLRLAVVHVDCPAVAETVAAELRARWGDREILIAPATPVLATHLGPGAWGLGYQLED